MWTRKELKDKAKATIKKSYWKVVLVSLILAMISGGIGVGSSYRFGDEGQRTANEIIMENQADVYEEDDDYDSYQENASYENTEEVQENKGRGLAMNAVYIAGFVVVGVVIFAIIVTIFIAIAAFVINPLEIGIRRFFSHELRETTQIRELAYAFDHSYMNVVKTMFFRDLYTFLWCLLLIIPGIVKAYEYRMIPYLLGDDPQMSKEEAFAKSKEMMDGQKWNTFVLDLSFIGWNILCMMTFGILSIFYVCPYCNLTDAALYNRLAGKDDEAEMAYTVLEE